MFGVLGHPIINLHFILYEQTAALLTISSPCSIGTCSHFASQEFFTPDMRDGCGLSVSRFSPDFTPLFWRLSGERDVLTVAGQEKVEIALSFNSPELGELGEVLELGGTEFTRTELRKKRGTFVCVIAVKNEGSRLANQLLKIRNENCEKLDVIIADGPSTDGSTAAMALSNMGVTSIITPTGQNAGLSTALRAAFLWCMEEGYKGVIMMDGNDKDDPSNLKDFVRHLEGGHDYIQGSRFAPGGIEEHTPLRRKFLIVWVHAPYMSFLSGRRFSDTTNGFRAFSRRLLLSEALGLAKNRMDRYELPYIIAWTACLQPGFKAIEIPVARRYPATGPTPTKIVGLAAYWEMIKPLLLLTALRIKLLIRPR